MSDSIKLNNRILWHDGSLTMTPEQIMGYLLAGNVITDKIYVSDITDEDVKKYNNFSEKKLDIKNSLSDINTEWNVPDEFKNINVRKYVAERLSEECEKRGFSDREVEKRVTRTEEELKLFKEHNINELLKTLIYIVTTFKENKIVWGTGRGSSCSSYLLYLIHLHDVDSVKYELNINEFLR